MSNSITPFFVLSVLIQVNVVVVSLHGCGDEEAKRAKNIVREASENRLWVLVNNIHTNLELLSELPAFLKELPPMEDWKLWLSSHGDCAQMPVRLLHSASKIVLDSPLSLRGSVLHSLSCTAGELISSSSRPEWLPILHNMIMLHATLRLRKVACSYAWAQDYQWKLTHLMVCPSLLALMYSCDEYYGWSQDILDYLRRELKNSELSPPGTSGVRPI